MGRHFAPRREGLPRSYSESVFNRLKPEGITRGDMYELHYKADPKFKGTGFPARVGGGGWSGAALGLKEYGLAGRIWRLQPSFKEFLTQLDRALREDGRLSQIGWFRDREDQTRSPYPVDAS
jgi:hypothetical protein